MLTDVRHNCPCNQFNFNSIEARPVRETARRNEFATLHPHFPDPLCPSYVNLFRRLEQPGANIREASPPKSGN